MYDLQEKRIHHRLDTCTLYPFPSHPQYIGPPARLSQYSYFALSSAEASREIKGERRSEKRWRAGDHGFLPPSHRSPRAHYSLPQYSNRFTCLACSSLPFKILGDLCGGERLFRVSIYIQFTLTLLSFNVEVIFQVLQTKGGCSYTAELTGES